MNKSICGANCDECSFNQNCPGCEATCGKPFGGRCIAAEYIIAGGKEKYAEFKQGILDEINFLLSANDIPQADALYELRGSFVNLAYMIPSGEKVKFLDDRNIYLGTQIELDPSGLCCGVVAGMDFILICRYGLNGSDPELITYQKR